MAASVTIVRSPADVLRTVVAAVVLLVVVLVEWLFGDTLVSFASDLLAGFGALASLDRRLGRRRHPRAGRRSSVLVVGVVLTAARSGRRVVLPFSVRPWPAQRW